MTGRAFGQYQLFYIASVSSRWLWWGYHRFGSLSGRRKFGPGDSIVVMHHYPVFFIR